MKQHTSAELDTKLVESTFLATRTDSRGPEETSADAQSEEVQVQKFNMSEVSHRSENQEACHEAKVHRSVGFVSEESHVNQVFNHQPAVQVTDIIANHPKETSHVSDQPTESPADRSGSTTSRSVSFDSGRSEVRGCDLRVQAPGRNLREGLGRPRVDQFHDSQVRKQQDTWDIDA